MKRILFYTICILLINGPGAQAQDGTSLQLSLDECIAMVIDKNINIRTAKAEWEKSRHKISENRAALLPKINVNGSFQDNFKLPVTLLPGEIVGNPGTQIAANVGTTFSTSVSASLSMPLYNRAAITAVRLAEELSGLSKLNIDKAAEALGVETAKLFYLGITTREQKKLVDENIERTEDIRRITKIMLDNGFARAVDYDRINISLENLYTQQSTVAAAYEQQINMMKYLLGLPIDTNLILAGQPEEALYRNENESGTNFAEHIDIQLLEQQKNINSLNSKIIADGYIPSLALTGQFAVQGYRDEFKNYFRGADENRWYNSSYIGVSLSVPVFDGFEKRSKSRQAKLDIYKTEMQIDDTKSRMTADFRNATNDYSNNKQNVIRQKKNVALAVKVYDETALRFKEGLASMSDLLQDEMSLNSAQSAYLTSLYNFKEAEIALMTLGGNFVSKIMNDKL